MEPTCQIRYQVAVAAGKGGVGKSSVCMSLAITLKQLGYSVGVLDADLYGPSLGKMMPLDTPIVRHKDQENCFYPGSFEGIKVFSVAQLREDALIVRAPIVNSLLLQCSKTILWGELDYLLVDFPPGTGDLQLTLLQEMAFSGVVLVTMPQEIATNEVVKTAQMFLSAQIPILGIVENMAYFEEPVTKKKWSIFGGKGGEKLSELLQVPLLGQVPLDSAFCLCADKGENFQKLFPLSTFTKVFYDIVPKAQEILWNLSQKEDSPSLELIEKTTLLVHWENNEMRVLLADLQRHCPCVVCQSLEVIDVQQKVEAEKVSFVGNYAVQIGFTSGCAKGVYAFSLLKKLAQETKRML